MFKRSLIIVTVAGAMLAACGGGGSTSLAIFGGAGDLADKPDGGPARVGTPVALSPIVSNSISGVKTPRQVVITDSDAWARLWAEHDGGATALPAIDFSREDVIGVFRGAQISGCHGTGIDSVVRLGERSDGRLLVRQVDVDPGPGLVCTTAIVYPARLVAVARSEAGNLDRVEFSPVVRLLQ